MNDGFKGIPRPTFLRNKTTSGYSLVYAVAMSTLLLFSGLAYLKWQFSTHYSSHHQIAGIQAFYTAQAAIIAVPIAYLRSTALCNLNFPELIYFEDGVITNFGKYSNARIQRVNSEHFKNNRNEFVCSATGHASFATRNSRNTEVKRKVYCRINVSASGLNRYLWFTDLEQTRFGEMIWFSSGDTIRGRVHSNSTIGVHYGAVFLGVVTSASRIINPYQATFLGQPPPGYHEYVTRIQLPDRNEPLRAAAAANGTWLTTSDHTYTYGLQLHGTSASIWRWQTGTDSPFGDPFQITSAVFWDPGNEYAIFCDGEVWIKGTVRGRLGIGAAGNLRLMDNIVYEDAQTYPYRVSSNSPNFLTLVSEEREPTSRLDPLTGILIANTWENGREDGGNDFPIGTNQNRRDIAIHGQLMATNSSFTFQQQNDNEGYDPYLYSCPQHRTDQRGYIYFTGTIVQRRRGYFHRGNTQTTGIRTGYLKQFYYDTRFEWGEPPFAVFPDSTTDRRIEIRGWFDDPIAAFNTNRRNFFELGEPSIEE